MREAVNTYSIGSEGYHPTTHESLCFPSALTISYSDGVQWVSHKTVTGIPVQAGSVEVIYTFPTVYCNGTLVIATVLRDDTFGNYAFQLEEARAGFNPGL